MIRMRSMLKDVWWAIRYTLCNERGMAWVGVALAAAGAAASIYGVTRKQKAQKIEQKGLAENYKALMISANRMRINALASEQSAEYQAKLMRIERRQLISTQAAGYGKAGVVLSEGTPLIVMEETVALAVLDELAVLYSGKIQAQEYRNIAKEYEYQAKAVKKGGQATAIAGAAGKVELAGAILTGATNIYQAYSMGKV